MFQLSFGIIFILSSFISSIYSNCIQTNYNLNCYNMTKHELETKLSNYHDEHLTNIELNNIHLGSIEKTLFTNFRPSVTSLTFKNCEIHSIEKDSLHTFSQELRKLTFIGNSLIEFNTEVFHELPHLQELDLTNNDIHDLIINCDKLPHLQKLILDNNPLYSLKNNFTTCHDLKILKIQNSKLEYIDLDFGYIFPSLTELVLHNNNLHTFEIKSNLIHLDLSDNKLNHFNITAENLISLDMSNNYLVDILPNTLNNMKNLQTLILCNAGIEKIKPHAFDKLIHLINIDLQENYLEHLENYTFIGLESIQILNLHNLNIKNIDSNAFHGLMHLKILDLSHNEITTLKTNIFSNLPLLYSLKLNNNEIQEITCNLFDINNNLNEFDLSNNEIKQVSTCVFEKLHDLHKLNLHNNNIVTFKIGSFTKLNNLYYLDISYNKLNSIHEAVVFPLTHLHIMNISGNHFVNLNLTSLLRNVENIQEIDFTGNIWDCHKLLPIMQYLRSHHIHYNYKSIDYDHENIDGIECFNHDKTLINKNVNYEHSELSEDTVQKRILNELQINNELIENFTNNFKDILNKDDDKLKHSYFEQIVKEIKNLHKISDTVNTILTKIEENDEDKSYEKY